MSGPPQPFSSHAVFDDYEDDYEHACQRGLALSGESRDYFAAERVARTAAWVARAAVEQPRTVADFGCGLGHSVPHLQRHFPFATLLGLDVSETSLKRARQRYGEQASFALATDHRSGADNDLVYCNGVFHHIRPADRALWAQRMRELVTPGGLVALWENNPWNPGARLVMRRIPFDRDAVPLSFVEVRRLLRDAGFEVIGTRFHFYFPRLLSWLRPLEPLGLRIPLAAQYCVLARRPLGRGDALV